MLVAVVCVTSLMVMAAEAATMATPRRCCFEEEWTASIGEVGARVTSGSSSTLTGSMDMSYDFYKKKVRTRSQVYVNGVPSNITTLRDFANRKIYETPTLGRCTVRSMPDTMEMLPPCVPADATFLGHAQFGYGSETLQANSWEFKLHNNTVLTKLALTEDCVPVFESFMSKSNGAAREMTWFYTGYNPGIDDMSTLDPPTDCSVIADDNNNNNNNNNNGNRPIG